MKNSRFDNSFLDGMSDEELENEIQNSDPSSWWRHTQLISELAKRKSRQLAARIAEIKGNS